MTESVSSPLVSVIIPTRNAGPQFEQTLQAIHSQQTTATMEIVVVDSGSTDSTPALARQYANQLLEIDPVTFNHGATRNLGIENSQGQYALLLVQDALPANQHWLQHLLTVLETNPIAAGAYSRQIPHQNDNFLVKFLTEQWFQVQGRRQVVQAVSGPQELDRMTFMQKRIRCGFEDVSSLIRREVWQAHPFRLMQFAEDIDWAHRVMRAGYTVVYQPDSIVIHSHDRPFKYNLKRNYIDGRALMQILGADPPALRHWLHPLAAAGLTGAILRQSIVQHAFALPLVGKVGAYVTAVMLATGLRRLLYPRVEQPNALAWQKKLDAWLSKGV